MSGDNIQKLREAHEAIKRDLRKLVGDDSVFEKAKTELAQLRESLTLGKSSRYMPLVGAVTGLAVVGVGYLAAEALRPNPSEKWTDKIQHRAGPAVGRNL